MLVVIAMIFGGFGLAIYRSYHTGARQAFEPDGKRRWPDDPTGS